MNRESKGNELARAQTARHVEALLLGLGADLRDPDLRGTPARAAEMLEELLRGDRAEEAPELSSFAGTHAPLGIVIARGLSFYSLCAHHLLPFFGEAHVGYLPGERLAALGDLARVVDHFSRRLTLQERIADEVADFLEHQLHPRGVAVYLEGRHLCLEMRGQKKQAHFEVGAFRGELADPIQRAEFWERVKEGPGSVEPGGSP
jgi:GTP cyclohydrolase I